MPEQSFKDKVGEKRQRKCCLWLASMCVSFCLSLSEKMICRNDEKNSRICVCLQDTRNGHTHILNKLTSIVTKLPIFTMGKN